MSSYFAASGGLFFWYFPQQRTMERGSNDCTIIVEYEVEMLWSVAR